jgi:hypothetical protein
MKHKFDWVLRNHHKVIDRQNNLIICHRSLAAAIQLMQMIEMGNRLGGHGSEGTGEMIHEAPGQLWVQEEHEDSFRSPHMRQKHRRHGRNLSLPNHKATGDTIEGTWTRM